MVVGTHIGQYRIVRELGVGGMGTVYLAEHRLLGRRAAIKTLLPALAIHPEVVERFFNEARATSSICNPGVIQIFDFGYHVDGTAYIVMELLEGESLSDRIARLGRLSVAASLRIARQCASALAAAHARDIVHRDLKPENVFLVRDPEAQGGERAKILDFGICKVGSSDASITLVGTTFGTPAYMSPEQCRGAGGVDARSDIYSFGCTVFHALTGRPPFPDQAPGELIVAHMQDPAPAPSGFADDIPEAVDELVLRCLAKDPDDRPQSMAELQLALGEVLTALGLPTRSEPPPRPAVSELPIEIDDDFDVEPARRRGVGRFVIAVALCAIAAAMVAVAAISDLGEASQTRTAVDRRATGEPAPREIPAPRENPALPETPAPPEVAPPEVAPPAPPRSQLPPPPTAAAPAPSAPAKQLAPRPRAAAKRALPPPPPSPQRTEDLYETR